MDVRVLCQVSSAVRSLRRMAMVSSRGRDTLRPRHLLPMFVLSKCRALVCGQVLKGLVQWAVLAEVSGRNVGGLGCFTTVTE